MQKQIQPNIFLSGWVCFFYLHLIHCNPNNVFMCWVKALSLAWALILVKSLQLSLLAFLAHANLSPYFCF